MPPSEPRLFASLSHRILYLCRVSAVDLSWSAPPHQNRCVGNTERAVPHLAMMRTRQTPPDTQNEENPSQQTFHYQQAQFGPSKGQWKQPLRGFRGRWPPCKGNGSSNLISIYVRACWPMFSPLPPSGACRKLYYPLVYFLSHLTHLPGLSQAALQYCV